MIPEMLFHIVAKEVSTSQLPSSFAWVAGPCGSNWWVTISRGICAVSLVGPRAVATLSRQLIVLIEAGTSDGRD